MPATTEEITQLWPQVSRRVHDRLRLAFRDSGLPPLSLGLLRLLQAQPGLTVSELARHVNVAKSYISRTVEQLVQLGCAERRADEADQRLVRLYVTAGADDVMHELAVAAAQAWREILAGLEQAELDTVQAGLQVLLRALTDDADDSREASLC